MTEGKLIAFEGGYSTGKTTQAKLFYDRLVAAAEPGAPAPVFAREPGGTPLGERVRDLLLEDGIKRGSAADLMLFCAARAQLVEDVLRPALRAGRDVVLDRYWPSSIVYQAILGGVHVTAAHRVTEAARGFLSKEDALEADAFVWLRLPPEEMARRTATRPARHRFHLPDPEKVDDAYERVMKTSIFFGNVLEVDASGTQEEVEARVSAAYDAWTVERRNQWRP